MLHFTLLFSFTLSHFFILLGRSKGFAHIDFASPELCEVAVSTLQGVELLGRPLRVDHAAKKVDSMNRAAAPPVNNNRRLQRSVNDNGQVHSIFLGNLSWDVTPELVEDMLNDVLGPNLFNQGKSKFL